MHPFLDTGGAPAVLAHRGYCKRHPENTMAAFEDAIRLGVRYLETDVQATSDGMVVTFHDETLERLAGTAGLVSETSWTELRRLKVAAAEPVPRLDEVLAAWPDARINIDAKSDHAVRPLLRLLEDHDAWERVCLGSFSGRRLEEIRDAAGSRLCTSMGPMEAARLRVASVGIPVGRFRANCAQIPLTHRGIPVVDKAFVAAAHSRNLPVHVWTINDPDEMERVLDCGADGIVTDELPAALAAISRRLKPPNPESAGSER